jgi:hypothetical protein
MRLPRGTPSRASPRRVELHYAQLVSEGKVDREIECRGGLWQVVGIDGELQHRDLVPRIQDGYGNESVRWDWIRDCVIVDQLRWDLRLTAAHYNTAVFRQQFWHD